MGLAVAALAALAMAFRLDALPGLSADEAWVGLRAMEYQKAGFISFHGMNWYTGAFHVWLVSRVFDIFGTGLVQLRLAGVALNALAAGGMAYFVALVYGLESAAVLAALLVALPFYPLESRIAWEVCALQNILAMGVITSGWRIAVRDRYNFFAALAFIFASALGTINHLIFVALPLGFAAGFFIWQAQTGDRRVSKIIFISVCNMAALATLVVAKKKLSDSFWLDHRTPVALFFAAIPAVAAFAAWKYQDFGARLCSAITAAARRRPALNNAALYLAVIGLAACLWFHGTAFLGVLSGFNVYKRMFSLDMGFAGALLLFVFAALLTGGVLSEIRAELQSGGQRQNRLFAALALMSLCAVFPLVRNTNSMRYYVVPYFVFAFTAAVFLPGFFRRAGGRTRAFIAVGAAALCLITCVELLAPQNRRPLNFRQGWHGETSARMMNISWLAQKMEKEKTCRFAGDPFIALPLEFLYRAKPWSCDTGKKFTGEYCYTCAQPPYIK